MATATYKHHSISKAKLQSQNANESWETIPGEVKIFGRDESDCLLFNKDTYVSFERIYIADSGCEILCELFPSNEASNIEKYDPPINRVAMVLLINELFSINGNVTYSNVSTILLSNGIEVTQSTIKKSSKKHLKKRSALQTSASAFEDSFVLNHTLLQRQKSC